jgi:hypothetical protein
MFIIIQTKTQKRQRLGTTSRRRRKKDVLNHQGEKASEGLRVTGRRTSKQQTDGDIQLKRWFTPVRKIIMHDYNKKLIRWLVRMLCLINLQVVKA